MATAVQFHHDCSAFEQAEIRALGTGSEFGLLRRNHEVLALQFPER